MEHGSGAGPAHFGVHPDRNLRISSGDYPNRAVQAGDVVMSPLQREAPDAVQRIAASPDTYLDMSIGEGDIRS